MFRSVRSVRSVHAVLAATAVTGAFALTAQAAPSAAAAPVVTAPVATSRPVPAPFADALATAARRGVGAATQLPVASGVRPIGAGVSTDLPTRIEIQDPGIYFSYVVRVPTGSIASPAIAIALATADGSFVLNSYTAGTRGQSTYSGALGAPISAVRQLGSAQWIVSYGASGGVPTTASLGTTIKLRSLLGQQLSRSGTTVRVFGSAKDYAGDADAFLPRVGRPVTIQRWSRTGWLNLRTVRTDSRGHISASLQIPWKVGIRLVTPDTQAVFGAATRSGTI